MAKLYGTSEILTCAESMALLLREVISSRNMALTRIEELERMESDILREMERPRCLYPDRARLATKLQQILSERRELKDWLRSLRAVLSYIDSDKGSNLQKWLDGFVGAARKG